VKKPLVAIVDDDSAFSSYLRTFLSLRGYETRAYSRGDEMLAAIRQGDPPDIVLLDVMMPGMDGLETLRNLKAARPELQAIMLSGRERASTIVEAVQLGAANYVIKPDDPEGLGEVALEAAIKSAIEKSRLVSELNELRQQLSDDQDRAVWGRSERMVAITRLVDQVADSDVTVLIRGESGVGKELVARAVHQNSSRRQRPFVKVNCAALPADLLESELFGHEKGAFTGAATTRIGKFEQADGGTIFMDEIAEMKPALQAKLLHVLQDAEFTKLGSNKRVTVDVRVVAATNRDLEAMMLKGDFREDLYYRLKVIDVHVPALRERRDEIDPLTEFFIARYARRYNRPARPLSDALRQQFHQYDWPGNVRELENMIKRIVVLQDESLVIQELARGPRQSVAAQAAQATLAAPQAEPVQPPVPVATIAVPPQMPIPYGGPVGAQQGTVGGNGLAGPLGSGSGVAVLDAPAPPAVSDKPMPLAEVAKNAAVHAERIAIEEALHRVHWNRRKAAVQLGVSYKTLLNKIKECGISRK
jgi:two-component system, NtrC family, response regulator AtoC